MGFFSKIWMVIRGFFIRAGDDVVSSSPEHIKNVYAVAISDAQKNYTELESAVALLARERERTEERLRALDKEEEELNRKLEGALVLAEAEPGNPTHREAGTRYTMRIAEIDQQQAKLTQDLEVQRSKVEDYKSRLRDFRNEIEKLKREQGEMVAEWVSTQQMLTLERKLQGISDTTTDQAIIAIREKVANQGAQVKIAREMNQADGANLDKKYEEQGAKLLAASKFDELLKARTQAKAGEKVKDRDLG